MEKTRRNEFDVTIDNAGIKYLEVLVEHGEGEIWAKFSVTSRLLISVTLYTDGNEVDIMDEVLSGWAHNPMFRTIEDIQELMMDIELWTPGEPDYAEYAACRDEARMEDSEYRHD